MFDFFNDELCLRWFEIFQSFLSCVSLLTTSGGAVVLTTIGRASHPAHWIICGESDRGGREREREKGGVGEREGQTDRERVSAWFHPSARAAVESWSGAERRQQRQDRPGLDLISPPSPVDSFTTSGSITETRSCLL